MNALFASFVTWFNQNLTGDTIFTANDSTVKTRIRQYAHTRSLTPDAALMLTLQVSVARNEASRV